MTWQSHFLAKRKFSKLIMFYLAAVLITAFSLVAEIRPAQAAGTLTACTNFNFLAALSGGGLVKFNCDGVIYFGGTITLSKSLTLDATGHNVTLAGPKLFNVQPGATLTLKNITLTNQGAPASQLQEGGIVVNAGNLVATGVTFKNSTVYQSGGAIANSGIAAINNSTFQNNKSNRKGGAISNYGSLAISNSSFTGNQTGDAGGAIYSARGTVSLYYTTFTGNKATYMASEGGALFMDKHQDVAGYQSILTMEGAYFESNTVNNGRGGAVSNYGLTTITNTNFKWNGDQYLYQGQGTDGGAVYTNSPKFSIEYATFHANYGTRGGAIFNDNAAVLSKVTFNYNSATNGGGFYNNGGNGNTVRVLNSTFAYHQVSQQGGAIYNNQKGLTIINSTISNNSAYGSATAGASIYNSYGSVYLYNSIVNSPQSGKNCAGSAVLDVGNNIQYPGTTCGQSILSVNPLLGPLTNNGGARETMALLPGSPAINHGNNFVCTNAPMDGKDQRGLSRTTTGNCDTGAFEVQPNVPAQAPGQKK